MKERNPAASRRRGNRADDDPEIGHRAEEADDQAERRRSGDVGDATHDPGDEAHDEALSQHDEEVSPTAPESVPDDRVDASSSLVVRDLRERALAHPWAPREQEEHEDASDHIGRDAPRCLLCLLRGVLTEVVHRFGDSLLEMELAGDVPEPR